METRTYHDKPDQRGFAAIVVALVLILVLSLLTIGFAELMRHEQRSALDKQLSSQAYYAAESGVNDAVSAVAAGFKALKTSCGPYNNPASSQISDPTSATAAQQYLTNTPTNPNSNQVGTTTSASYPCLLINPAPPKLLFQNVGITNPEVFEMQGVDAASGLAATINTIEISWQQPSSDTNTPGFNTSCNGGTFPPASSTSGNTGMLRAEIIPAPSGAVDRNTLTASAYTAYLCPNPGSGAPGQSIFATSTGTQGGTIALGNCKNPNTPSYCNTQVVLPNTNTTYFVVLQAIYLPVDVTVTACATAAASCPFGDQLNIADAQVLIDSTGKAQDVLRRVQVHFPLNNSYNKPIGTTGLSSICKQLAVSPNGSSSSSSCTIP